MAVHSAQKMRRIVAEVGQMDRKFAPLIERRPLCTIGRSAPTESHFESLVSSIISQQLAVKAAETIHGRLVVLCKGTIAYWNRIVGYALLMVTDEYPTFSL